MAQATHATQITHAPHGTPCGRCGAALAASSQFCTRCGAPRLRRSTHSRSRAAGGIRLARMPQIAAAVTVDVVLGAALIAGAVLLGISAHDVNLWIVYSVAVALAAAAHVYVLLHTGQSLGARLAGVRLVSSVTWSAPGTRLKSLQVTDVRGGEDPLAPQLPPAEVTLGERAVTAGHAVVAPQRKGWVLIIDEERRVPLTGSFVVGRNPAVDPGETAVAVPDLGRLLSKGHLRFDVDPDGSVFVTDLGSTNGSQIDADVLVPYERAAVTADARIHAGDHVFRVENRAHTREGARR